jgi:translocation and assembly module TamB
VGKPRRPEPRQDRPKDFVGSQVSIHRDDPDRRPLGKRVDDTAVAKGNPFLYRVLFEDVPRFPRRHPTGCLAPGSVDENEILRQGEGAVYPFHRGGVNKRPLIGDRREEVSVADDGTPRSEPRPDPRLRSLEVLVPVRRKEEGQRPRLDVFRPLKEASYRAPRQKIRRLTGKLRRCSAFGEMLGESSRLRGRSRSVEPFKHDKPRQHRHVPREGQHPDTHSILVIGYLITRLSQMGTTQRAERIRETVTSLLFVALLIGAVFGGRVFSRHVESRVRLIRDEGIATLEEATSQELAWDAVSPSVLQGITIYGVRISGNAAARSVVVRINPASLLWGDPRDLIPEVIVNQPTISVTSPEERARLERTLGFVTRNAQGRRDLIVRVRRGTLTLGDTAGTVALSNVSGDIELVRTRISGVLSTAVQLDTEVSGDPFTVGTTIRAELQGRRGGPDLSANLELTDIEGTHLAMASQSFRIERRADTVYLERVRSSDPLDLTASFDEEMGTIAVSVLSQDYRPEVTGTLHGPWAEYQPWLATRLTSRLDLLFGLESGLLSSEGSLIAASEHPDLPAPLEIDATYRADLEEIRLDRFVARSGSGRMTFRGSYRFGEIAPNGTVSFRSFSYGPLPILTGEAVVSSTRGGGGISSEQLTVNGALIHRIVGSISTGPRYNSARLSVALDPEGLNVVDATARFASLDDLTGEVRFRDTGVGQLADVAGAFGRPLSVPEAVRAASVNGVVRVDRREGQLSLSVPYMLLEDPANGGRSARLSGTYRNGTVLLDQLVLVTGGTRVHTTGFLRIGSAGTIDFETQVTVNSVRYPLRGTYSPRGELVVFGPDGIEVRVDPSRGGFRLEARLGGIAIPIGKARVDARLEGLFFSPEDWFLSVTDLHVSDLPAPGGGTADLRMAVGLGPQEGRIGIISFTDDEGTLAGTFDVSYRFRDDLDVQLSGSLGAFDTEERYRIASRYSAGQIAVDVRFENSPARRLATDARSGTVGGALQVVGTFGNPQIRAFLETDSLRLSSQEVEARVLLYLDESEVRVSGSDLVVGTSAVRIDEVRLDRATGALTGRAGISRVGEDWGEYRISLRGDAGEVPTLSMGEMLERPVFAQVAVTLAEESADAPTSAAAEFALGTYRFERIDGESRLRRDDGAIDVYVSDRGAFQMSLAAPLPVQLQASGQVRPGDIEITASGITVDLSTMAALLGLAAVEVPSGTARGSLRILGSPSDPDFFGTIAIRDLTTTTPVGPDVIGPLNSTLIFEEKLIRMPLESVPAGGATIELSAQAIISRLALEEYELNLVVSGDEGVRVDRAFGPVYVDGTARGSVVIGGNLRDTRLEGRLFTSGTEILIEERQPRPGDDGGRSIALDLEVETGRAVQFIWPDRDFPVLRSNFATGQTILISADTATEQFALTGNLDIQSGDVFYFDRNFLIRDGQISFNESQDEFDPRLSARAELREVTPEGPVRIFLVADGQRLSEFSPRFESNPPLPGNEIIAILGGNIFQQGGSESVNLTTALLSTSDVVTQFGVFRQFEDAVRERLDLDLFAIRTSVIQNVLLSAITPADETVTPVTPSLGSYLNDTSIFMGRYLGDAVFGQAVLQLRSREMEDQREEDPGIQRLGGVLIDSEISLEWQTPFFLLEWNFAPQNPEELFIRDNTFTFSWSFSY